MTNTILLVFTEKEKELLNLIDKKRGLVGRSTFVKQVILKEYFKEDLK